MKEKISRKKVMFFCAVVTTSFVLSLILNPCIVQNSKITELFITVFSILAGVLVAVITVVGDPSCLYPGSWRLAFYHAEEIERQLKKCSYLFYGYLTTITLIFISYMVEKSAPRAVELITGCYSFFGFVTFAYSWTLPSTLHKIQTEKLESIVENRKENHE